jgi:DNA-binding SARP family transcriptional activator/predicted ATPase
VAVLQFYFLGPLDIRSGDRQLPRPPTLKSQSLLAYLVLHRNQPQPRERLTGLFWGERPDDKARRSLSTALWHIRRCLGGRPALLGDSHTVQFDPQSPYWLDVAEFETKVAAAGITSLQEAVALYRGAFLDGFYDEWIVDERYRLEAIFLEALTRLMHGHEETGAHQEALATALRLLGHDSLREDAHRLAMRAYCALGQRNTALAQYKRYVELVLAELGTEPMREATQLYRAILKEGAGDTVPDGILSLQTLSPAPAGRDPLDVTAPVRLIGREQELRRLHDAWQRSRSGCGGLTLISGEVGVGKTRLVEEFAGALRWRGARVLRGRCYEFERAQPYQPFADVLRAALPEALAGGRAELPPWALRELARLVPEYAAGTDDLGTLGPLAQLVAPEADRPTTSDTDPRQARLFEAVSYLLAKLSADDALLLVLEDLHWAGASTLQLLYHLARTLQTSSLMIVGTFRPEVVGAEHPLRTLRRQLERERAAQLLRLSPLSLQSVETMLAEMSGAGAAIAPLAARLFRETEGNPFFLMEMVKVLFESELVRFEGGVWQGDFDQISGNELPLPSSVSAVVEARVQRLDARAQEALRLAAVLGREFSFDLLGAVWPHSEETMLEALDELLRQRLVEELVDRSDSDFAFTHHLIQEVGYHSLPRHRRHHWHAQVGEAMERLYADQLATRAGEVAHHFQQACLLDKSLCTKAVAYLAQACQQAVHQSASHDAIAYYRRGLAILQSLPATTERNQQEVELQIALAGPVGIVEGYAAPETKRVYERARLLCRQVGETPALFTSLVGLARHYGVRGETETALELAEQLLAIAHKTNDVDMLLEAYREMGGNLLALGEPKAARDYWERGVSLYDPERHERHAYRFGHDPIAPCLGYLSFTSWLLGYPDRAQEQSDKLAGLMQRMTHPSSIAYVRCQLAIHAYLRHDVPGCLHHAEAAGLVADVHDLPSWSALASALHAWAVIAQGGQAEALAPLQEGIKQWRARGFAHLAPLLLTLEAEASLKLRKLEEGLEAIVAALALTTSGVDRFWLPEVSRLRGELLLAQGAQDELAETAFTEALQVARQQEAKMLELRAATSLARFWHAQGRPQAAQELLAAVYERFDEGFDNDDLQLAATLLRQCRAQPSTV